MRAALLTLLIMLTSIPASAEVLDFGGSPDHIKGGGDKEPPRCQFDIPSATTEAFSIKWSCFDNFSEQHEIRTELYMYTTTNPGGSLIGKFLGFPAAAFVDATALGVTDFSAGLPASFRLVASDRSGISSISQPVIVTFGTPEDDSDDADDDTDTEGVTSCDLTIVTEETESTGSQTGIPSMSVELTDVETDVSEGASSDAVNISTADETADPCEIDTICAEGDLVSFTGNIVKGESGTATGTVTISPSDTEVSLTGTATGDSGGVSSANLAGTTTIDGAEANVTLTCATE